MSEQEFDLYLSLLGKFLHLKPEQREEIADELRDHLEERMVELTAAGYEREQAIEKALEEFGDANALASHFTHLSQRRTRRRIMRWTLGSVTMLAIGLVLGNAFWPQAPDVPGQGKIIAQNQPGTPGVALPQNQPGTPGITPGQTQPVKGFPKSSPVPKEAKNVTLEAKLGQEVDLAFEETSLSEALEFLSQAVKVDILVDRKALEDEGVQLEEATVTLRFQFTTVTAKTALELILDQHDLISTVREGFIMVQTEAALEDQMTTEVYPCADLVAKGNHLAPSYPSGLPGAGYDPAGGPGVYQGSGEGYEDYGEPAGDESGSNSSRSGYPGVGSGYAPGLPGTSTPGYPGGGTGVPIKPKKAREKNSTTPGTTNGFPNGAGALLPTSRTHTVANLNRTRLAGLETHFHQLGDSGFFGGGMGAGPVPNPTLTDEESALINVIQSSINPDTWEDLGGRSSIQMYQGILIVRSTPDVHADIETLLEKMRGIRTPKKTPAIRKKVPTPNRRS